MRNAIAYGRWLRARREEVVPRLTRSQLAKLSGLSVTYISRLEKAGVTGEADICNPGLSHVDKISRVLERFHDRPLVNEARRILGYEGLDEEPVAGGATSSTRRSGSDVTEIMSQLLENSVVLDMTRRVLAMTRDRQEGVARLVERIELVPKRPQPAI